jgi:hypothetical protein
MKANDQFMRGCDSFTASDPKTAELAKPRNSTGQGNSEFCRARADFEKRILIAMIVAAVVMLGLCVLGAAMLAFR